MLVSDVFKGFDQYLNVKLVQKPNGKLNKIPVNTQGYHIDPLQPTNWKTYERAVQIHQETGFLIGFAFTAHDPFFFVDLDDAIKDDDWSSDAKLICSAFPGCRMEISASKTGLHIFGTAKSPDHSCEVEGIGGFYTQDRFVLLTDLNASGDASTDGQIGVNWLVKNYFPPRGSNGAVGWTTEPVAEWNGPEDDDELLKIAYRSKSSTGIFGGKAGFVDLYEGNETKLAETWPSDRDVYDRSKADSALAMHLAFYTGKNCERIERIFNQSALGQRDKWLNRDDSYRKPTILKAVARCSKVYSKPTKTQTVNLEQAVPDSSRIGSQVLDIEQQKEFFKDCIYIIKKHRILTKRYGLLKPDNFKATYGGYGFVTRAQHNGPPTSNAFNAFTESQLYTFPKAHGTCFKPQRGWGEIIIKDGEELVNTYVDIKIPSEPGDVSLFLDLVQRILPDQREQNILLSYMASVIQNKGVKFQWAPLLQGVEGNGKTFMIRALSNAVGDRYTHKLTVLGMESGLKFTGWMQGKMLCVLEDLKITNKYDVIEGLKSLITDDRNEVQAKGVDQVMDDNCMNFMICSNHKDAVTLTANNRRYCTLFTAQQNKEDLARDGMSGGYFRRLYDWANAGGYANITHFLENYAIEEQFDPARGAKRAPNTNSTKEAVLISLGRPVYEVMEAIEEEQTGFRGGWISSDALSRLFDEKRMKVQYRDIPRILESIGYFRKERMTVKSPVDRNKKVVLYANALKMQLPEGKASSADYLKCQNDSKNETVERSKEVFN